LENQVINHPYEAVIRDGAFPIFQAGTAETESGLICILRRDHR